jgi:uncharacterized membrane protein YphA (DoxX/SURF4 family)
MRIAGLGQGLFAIASASLAIWSLTYGDFAWGAQSVLARIPWREAWVYGSALIVLAACAGLCFQRMALASVLALGAYHAVGAAISVPQILSKPLSIDAWYPFCEALTTLVGAWILYAMLRRQLRGSGIPIASDGAVRAATVLFGLTCVFYGWSHFVYADYTASMVPAWLPGRVAFAYFTGLAHVAAGLAITVGLLPRLAATLEAIMMSLFGLLVWAPSFFAQPRPKWATPPEHQWSEFVVTLVLAAAAWIVAISFENRSWAFASRSPVRMSTASHQG